MVDVPVLISDDDASRQIQYPFVANFVPEQVTRLP